MKLDGTRCLIIMDGFGYPSNFKISAINMENTKNLQNLWQRYPHTLLSASENSVGLPDNQPGTSDVGHLTIGTGRVKLQPLQEINNAILDGSFEKNKAILDAFTNAKKKGNSLHLLGIPTDGGVHGHIDHLIKLLEMASNNGVENVYIHYFTDGRDTAPKSAEIYLKTIENAIKKYKCGKIATVIGRLYALDRDKNWDRVEKAYNAMVFGSGEKSDSALNAIKSAYQRNETDEFILPTVIIDKNNEPIGKIKQNDSVIIYNYRADRERQLAYALLDYNDLSFGTHNLKLKLVTMTEYDNSLKDLTVAFPPKKMKNILSEVVCNAGLSQLKVAETEKFPYVTFAFNDGRLETYPNEERILINSVKMKTYVSKPEMSAREVAEATVNGILSKKYDFVVVNFANPDMVGHSGDIDATKKAIFVVDQCVQKVVDAVKKVGGVALITADHGNADTMFLPDGQPCTSHTTALVPCILVDDNKTNLTLKSKGTLADIAPTMLALMGISKPSEMTGNCLF